MKITTGPKGEFVLEEVFNPIVLITPAGEVMSLSMRDGGFEFAYAGGEDKIAHLYEAKEGHVKKLK